MTEHTLSFAVPAIDPEDDDRHGCCCADVVAELDAMLAPLEEIQAEAKSRYYACPHHELTPLEIFLDDVRRRLGQ